MASMASRPRLGCRHFTVNVPAPVDMNPVILALDAQRGLIDVHRR